MLPIFDALRDITLPSVLLRLLLAVFCGGAIGLEREYKRRPAGFRTHILICLGAAMTTLTSQYLCQILGYHTDPGRLGAQVIAGIGFIGAGAIIVTRRQRVKGLTTAAGLWTAAVIGLALGAGFYEGGLLSAALVLLAELLFVRIEYRVLRNTPELSLYMEYDGKAALDSVLRIAHGQDCRVVDMEITRRMEGQSACAILTLRVNKKYDGEKLLALLRDQSGVLLLEQL